MSYYKGDPLDVSFYVNALIGDKYVWYVFTHVCSKENQSWTCCTHGVFRPHTKKLVSGNIAKKYKVGRSRMKFYFILQILKQYFALCGILCLDLRKSSVHCVNCGGINCFPLSQNFGFFILFSKDHKNVVASGDRTRGGGAIRN